MNQQHSVQRGLDVAEPLDTLRFPYGAAGSSKPAREPGRPTPLRGSICAWFSAMASFRSPAH